MNIGKVIKKFREEKGMSQLSLGMAIGNDAAYISRIENGQYDPTLKTIVKIANTLEVDPIDILKDMLEVLKN